MDWIMRMRLKIALVAGMMLFGAASPASAIDLHNCSPVDLRLNFYNEDDGLELIAKRDITVRAGETAKGKLIPGPGTHKVKIFNLSAGKQFLVTLSKVDGRLSYVLFIKPDGTLGMLTGNGCGG